MDSALPIFVDEIFNHKKLRFQTCEIIVNEHLFTQNILKLDGDVISIDDYKSIAPEFIKKYEGKFKFIFTDDFLHTAKFINAIAKDFTSDGYIHDFYLLENEIWKYYIKESNVKFQTNFFGYLHLNDSETIFKFIQAYAEILPDLNLNSDEVLQNTISQLQSVRAEDENVYNMPLYSVLTGLKNKCKVDYRIGLELLNKVIEFDESQGNIVIAVVTGLYEKNREQFYNAVLQKIINSEKHLSSILFGLSNVQEISDSDSKLFLQLIEKYSGQESLQISVLSLIFSILKSENQQHYDLCFEKLFAFVENEKPAIFILKNINSITDNLEHKKSIILRIIGQPFFTIEKHIVLIGHFFIYNNDFETFKLIVLEIIKLKPFEKFISNFQSYYQGINKTQFDEFLIELLIDNSASKRFIGLEIINLGSIHISYIFSVDILALSPLSQYKLWVSLTLDYHQPDDRFTPLLPLIDSKSEFIRESFLCKLEEASQDYGGQISKILKSNLDNSKYSHVIERVENYISDFYEKYTSLKNSIKEFDPYNTDYKLVRKFNEAFHKKMNRSIDLGVKKNSLLSILGGNTVQLAKGGGWRSSSNKNISQLDKFGTSFTMPRTYFIDPNKYELEMMYLVNKNWTEEEFAEIKTILDNEQ